MKFIPKENPIKHDNTSTPIIIQYEKLPGPAILL
jgi:hypothetical protein